MASPVRVRKRPIRRWSGNLFFFFQAEDGIRDLTVTGVQTCALPISRKERDHPFLLDQHPYAQLLRGGGEGARRGRPHLPEGCLERRQRGIARGHRAQSDRKSVV